MGWILLILLPFLLITVSCESKQDKAQNLAKELVETVYKKNFPDRYKEIWSQIEKLYRNNNLTYEQAKPLCDKANELSREFVGLLDRYKKISKEKGVYNEFTSLLGKLRLGTDCLYSPSTALWSSIDSICSALKNKNYVDNSTWEEAFRKFQTNYRKAHQIKDECFKEVS